MQLIVDDRHIYAEASSDQTKLIDDQTIGSVAELLCLEKLVKGNPDVEFFHSNGAADGAFVVYTHVARLRSSSE